MLAALVLGALFAGLPGALDAGQFVQVQHRDLRVPATPHHRSASPSARTSTILSDPVKVRFFINSYVVALSVTALTLVVAILAAYAFSRFEFPFKRVLNVIIISVQAVPPITLARSRTSG